MKPVAMLLIFLFTCAEIIFAQVIDYDIDISFDSESLFIRGGISDVLSNDNGKILVTGMFNNLLSPAGNTSLLSSSGEFNMTVSGANFHRLGKFLGGYIHYGNTGVQRFNLPGQPSPDYTYEWSKPAYSGPLSHKGHDVIVLPDDHILVAGRFFTDSTLMGTNIASQGLRQLCMIDSTGAPVPGFPMLRCEWPTDSEIYNIAKLNSGGYIISGRFQEVEGHATNHVARLHEDFSVDTTFISPFAFRSGGVVFIQLIDFEDRIMVTGSNAELANDSVIYPGLVRLLPNGLLDTTFSIPDIIFINPPTGIVYPIRPGMVVEDHDGTYIVVGQFQFLNGSPRKGLAKLNENGELIEGSFEGFGVDEAVWGSWQAEPGINKIIDVGDGKWLLGGQFSSFGGQPYSCLVRLQPNGFVGTHDRSGRGTLKVYPNPASQYFRIGLPQGLEPMQLVELCDMQGRTLRSWPATHGPYALDGLPAGVYVVRARGREGVYTQKLILEP